MRILGGLLDRLPVLGRRRRRAASQLTQDLGERQRQRDLAFAIRTTPKGVNVSRSEVRRRRARNRRARASRKRNRIH